MVHVGGFPCAVEIGLFHLAFNREVNAIIIIATNAIPYCVTGQKH